MHGARRVVIFCLLTAVLPTILIIIPLYLRHNVFVDISYTVAESDVLEIDALSTVFCQAHTLKMNSSFSAYQMDNKPEISNTPKHIRLKKSMRLPDDTLEYWGFFLPKSSTVKLSVCSIYSSRIIVVKGTRNLETCGLLEHVQNRLIKGQIRPRFELPPNNTAFDEDNGGEVFDEEPKNVAEEKHKLRHTRSHFGRKQAPIMTPHTLDGRVVHGGNKNPVEEPEDTSSQSSFENALFDCFRGKTLHSQEFPPSSNCSNRTHLSTMITRTVAEDGYYHYIFYSDNDNVFNDIYTVFDIHKPTYQLSNTTKKCIKETVCHFPLVMFSNEVVIVEVPTRDGIEHEEEDLTLLTSVCQPRMGVYIIFPLMVLILILGCAFL